MLLSFTNGQTNLKLHCSLDENSAPLINKVSAITPCTKEQKIVKDVLSQRLVSKQGPRPGGQGPILFQPMFKLKFKTLIQLDQLDPNWCELYRDHPLQKTCHLKQFSVPSAWCNGTYFVY